MDGVRLSGLKVVFGFFLVLMVSLPAMAVDTSAIDNVRGKELLDQGDLKIIDGFVRVAVNERLAARDFTSVAQKRKVILRRTDSLKESAKAQYDEQFAESISKHIPEALKQAETIEPEDVRASVILNLMILIDNLANASMIDVAMDRIDDAELLVRY